MLKQSLGEYIFLTEDKNFINSRNLLRKFKKILKSVFNDENYIRWHDLRASYTTILTDSGVSIKYLQESLGHSTEKTTLKSYMKASKRATEQAMTALSNVFKIS